MSPRSIRRAAERKAAKVSKRNPKQGEGQPVLIEQQPPIRHATGPITAEGKAISCLNDTSAQGVLLPVVRVQERHGLTGSFRVLESESQRQFDELRDTLRAEHAPASATETLLVDRMAEHVWLSQRAQRLQDDELINGSEKTFALFLRYQTTNDRAFFKCLRELALLRSERQQFESQNASQSEDEFESQIAKQPRNVEEVPQAVAQATIRKDGESSNRKTMPKMAANPPSNNTRAISTHGLSQLGKGTGGS